MKYYGSHLCMHCVVANEYLEEHNIQCDHIDITNSIMDLQEFLALRDSRPEFKEAKEAKQIGIPCFVTDDDKIIFDAREL